LVVFLNCISSRPQDLNPKTQDQVLLRQDLI